MSTKALAAIKAEYDRCLDLWRNPHKSEPLFGVKGDDCVSDYYAARAEGLGFALDRLNRR